MDKQKATEAIQALIAKSHDYGCKADEALKYSQAALNVANALETIEAIEKQPQ